MHDYSNPIFSNSRIVFENDINKTVDTSTFVETDDGQHNNSFGQEEDEDQEQDATNSKE